MLVIVVVVGILMALLLNSDIGCSRPEKPVIYLYPTERTAEDIQPQPLIAPERTGFTVVERGGCEIDR